MLADATAAFFAMARGIWRASPGRAAALAVWLAWEAARPILQAFMVAHLVEIVAAGAAPSPGGAPGGAGTGLALPASGELFFWLAGAAALLAAQQALGPLLTALVHGTAWRVDRELGSRLLAAATRPHGIGHLEEAATADRINLARGGIAGASAGDAVRLLAAHGGPRLSALLSGVALAGYRWWAPLMVLLGVAVVRWWVLREGGAMTEGFRQATPRLRRAGYFRDLLLTPAAAKEVRVFGLAGWILERFRSGMEEGLAEVWRASRRTGGLLYAAVAVQWLALSAVAASLALAGARGELEVGAVAFFLQLAYGMLTLTENVDADFRLARSMLVFQQVEAVERSVERTRPEGTAARGERAVALPAAAAPTPGQAGPGARPQSEIRFEGVVFRYPGGGPPVFDGLDLTIPVGRSLAIVGSNGAGKTTLVKLLAGLYAPERGRITVDGVDLADIDLGLWRRSLAVIFQDFCRWELPVRDNLALAAPALAADDEALWRVLRRAGAGEVVSGLPAGLDTPLSRRFRGGTDLSGGQWQRIALARAFAAVERGASLLILDEPTASLDVRAEAAFYERFLEVTRGLTTILISHRFATVRLADRIVVLEGGRVLEDGSHEQLMDRGGRYATLFRLQAQQVFGPGAGAEGGEGA